MQIVPINREVQMGDVRRMLFERLMSQLHVRKAVDVDGVVVRSDRQPQRVRAEFHI